MEDRMTFCLYGVAVRENEHVCMFFPTMDEAFQFAGELPGTYHVMTLHGVDYDALTVGSINPVTQEDDR